MRCHICKKEIEGNYHKHTCDIDGIDEEFYTHPGDCDKKFLDESTNKKPANSRFEILDL